jgi:hypothetical protein
VDLYEIIRELHEERKRLDRLIALLERRLAVESESRTRRKSRRGRKFMGEEERKQVSERMRRYWAARRAAAQSGENPEGDGTATS